DGQRGARHSGGHTQGCGRFHRGRAGRSAGRAPPHVVHLRDRDDLYRRHFASGGRQGDIVRQFLTEAVLISIVGGLIGIGFGFTLSRVIATAAGWSTVVTTS